MLVSSELVLFPDKTEMVTNEVACLAHNSAALRALLARDDPDSLTTSKAHRASTTWDLQGVLVQGWCVREITCRSW